MRSGCWSAVNAPLLGDDNAPAFPDVRMVVDDIDQPCGLLARREAITSAAATYLVRVIVCAFEVTFEPSLGATHK